MPTPPEPAPPAARTASGRAVVIAFVAIAVVFGAAAVWFRLENNARIRDAQLKVLPTLAASVGVLCAPQAGAAVELRRGGTCAPGSTLSLSMASPAVGTRTVLYALVSADGAHAGELPLGLAASTPVGDATGPRTLLVLLASAEVPAAALQEALDRAPGDIATRVAAVDRLVASIIREEAHARVERFDFEARPSR